MIGENDASMGGDEVVSDGRNRSRICIAWKVSAPERKMEMMMAKGLIGTLRYVNRSEAMPQVQSVAEIRNEAESTNVGRLCDMVPRISTK
jgi:hypothetical protein